MDGTTKVYAKGWHSGGKEEEEGHMTKMKKPQAGQFTDSWGTLPLESCRKF